MSDDIAESKLQNEIRRLEHIVAVLQTQIGLAYLSAKSIEDNTRIENGRVQSWCLGEWVDVESTSADTMEEAGEPQPEQ